MHNLNAFKEKDFAKCYAHSSIADYHGIPVQVLEATELLTEKEKTNRLKDLVDIDYLKKLLGLK